MSLPAAGYVGAYPFFHRGATTLHFLEPIAVGTDPTISPGWARPLGWRVATADGLLAWDKTGVADTAWTPIAPGTVGVIAVDSPDLSILVTNPTGPTVHVEVNPATSTATLFDLLLSFGHGITADQTLTGGVSFWFSPTTIADFAVANQVREWVTAEPLGFVGLDVNVDAASFGEAGAGAVVVTVGGLDTALSVAISDGAAGVLQNSALLSIPAGSTVGVRWDPGSVADGSTFRAEIRLRGATTGTAIVPSTLPINPKALFVPEDLALSGNTWVDSVAGSLYTLTVPPDGPPPFGVDPISGPAWTSDGSFNNHPYGYFRHYAGGDFGHPTYTPCMLATSTPMFAPSAAPIPARTFVAVVRPDSSIGGIVASSQFTTPCFKGALNLPTGDLLQAAYFTNFEPGLVQSDNVIPAVNLAAQEIVLIWRTDGTTLEFFIDGVKQTLDSSVIGSDNAAGPGFCIGNLASSKPIGKNGWQGAIAFVGTWARKFTNAEVLSATSYCTTNYVTP